MLKQERSSRGFTLIELLVVIAIIGLLSSVVLASLNRARSKARDARRIQDIKQLMTALELYYDTNGRYPRSTSCGGVAPAPAGWCNSIQTYANGHWIKDSGATGVLAPFIAADPVDPKPATTPNWGPLNGGTYYYYSTGVGYFIVFGLENYPHPLEAQDGVRTNWLCSNTTSWHYGSGTNGIITIGSGCL